MDRQGWAHTLAYQIRRHHALGLIFVGYLKTNVFENLVIENEEEEEENQVRNVE